MSANAVVFLGMVYPWGIIRHFGLLGIELFKAPRNFDYYFAAISREPDKNSWELVRNTVPDSSIIESETFPDVVKKCEELFGRYDRVLIHCGGGWGQTKAFIPLRKRYGLRLILVGTTHSYRNDSWMRIPMSAFQSLLYFRYYDKIVFQCEYAVEKFWGSRLLFAAKKGVIIPLGCENFDNIPREMPSVIEAKTNLAAILTDKGLFKFVYLAAFRSGKKHVWLVRAIEPVLRKNPKARVLFCGTGDPKVIEAVEKTIESLCLQKQILLTGQIPREDVPWLLMHSDCAIVPSRAETFGHNFLEPMFAGLPVLGTRVGIGRDLIQDGLTGYVFNLQSVRKLRKGAELVLSCCDQTREMGRRAKSIVQKDFTHVAVARQLVPLYQDLLGAE